ncbi:MAG: tRNA dihydrouridine synthase DusB [Capsulimonadales bacterium]|nr:tRNA dihydrouridine synthase DusB [Capsulimonadales bacterium]
MRYNTGAMRYGKIEVWPNVVLAPMAGITSHPFRVLCKRHGRVGLVVTELISSMAIHYRNAKTFGMFDWTDEERPVFCQLFGGDPSVMAEAARVVVDRGADGVDINMGCWVPKVAKTGAGAALLKDLCQAEAVVKAVVEAVPSVPVTVKVRSGWDSRDETAPRFARAAAALGAKAVTVHARFASQGFTGTADWSVIARVREAVGGSIPVIGNGDIETPQDAKRMLSETGCDGVMVGRAAMGNPWLLARIGLYLETGVLAPEPSVTERIGVARDHARLQVECQGEDIACRELRGLLSHYFRGFNGASHIRTALTQVRSLNDIESVLDRAQTWYGEAIADPEPRTIETDPVHSL